MADDKSGKPPPLMGATAIRPPDRVGAEKYTYILYDPKNGTILTRTPKSWALIIAFYCVYYSCLAAFWIACMTIFLKIQIRPDEPTWKLDESIIGTNPGIGVRPSQTDEQVDTGIFSIDTNFTWAHGTDETEIAKAIKKDEEKLLADGKFGGIRAIGGSKGYAYRAHAFFKAYGKNDDGDGYTCDDDTHLNKKGYRKDKHKFCEFKRSELGQCEDFPYGYSNKKLAPCIFLKLNRIMGLEPKPIENRNLQDPSLEKDQSAQDFLTELEAQSYPRGVYIKCEGEYPADKEILHKRMQMFPPAPNINNTALIDLKYFPYDKFRKHNENPLVAIRFRPELFIKPAGDQIPVAGRLVHIICKAYYDKVIHSKKNKAGLVKFELYLETPKQE
jgi:sodium/potassium-transporting ATPase subunit beta